MRLSNRVAAVIREAREVAFESCVDDFVGTERHEVVVLVLVVVARSSLELVLTKHLAHVLDDEVTTAQQNKTSVTNDAHTGSFYVEQLLTDRDLLSFEYPNLLHQLGMARSVCTFAKTSITNVR